MAATFLERNKKKSLLAALLLFLRERKLAAVLLLLVLIASTTFLSPSSWLTGLPGGERVAAGVAWVAGKMGVDVSRWGLGNAGAHSYGDLLAAFRAARSGSTGGVGWGAFFGRGKNAGDGSGAASGSLDLVRGRKSDLEHGVGAGGGPQSVAGILDPSDPNGRGGDGVAISEADLGGRREGFVKEAFAGGFMNGLLGGAGDGALSGGAYASKGFFGGAGGAAGSSNGLASGALAGLPSVSTPPSKKGGAAKGALSAMASKAVETRAMAGVHGAAALSGHRAFTQLAEGSARDQLGTTYCKPPNCPSEYAATNTGAIYDGNILSQGFLTSSDPGGTGSGLINTTVDIPPDTSLGSTGDPGLLASCEDTLNTCESGKVGAEQHLTDLQDQMSDLMRRMPAACGDPCNCDPCTSLQNRVNAICRGADLRNTIQTVYSPCSLPASCNAMGIADPTSTSAGQAQSAMCKMSFGTCGPSGILGMLMCLL